MVLYYNGIYKLLVKKALYNQLVVLLFNLVELQHLNRTNRLEQRWQLLPLVLMAM